MAALLPLDLATQNDCVAGGFGFAVASTRGLSGDHGSAPKSVTRSICAQAGERSASALRATPTNTLWSLFVESAAILTRGWPSASVTSAVSLIEATSDTRAELLLDTSRWPELNSPSLPPRARMPPPPSASTAPTVASTPPPMRRPVRAASPELYGAVGVGVGVVVVVICGPFEECWWGDHDGTPTRTRCHRPAGPWRLALSDELQGGVVPQEDTARR